MNNDRFFIWKTYNSRLSRNVAGERCSLGRDFRDVESQTLMSGAFPVMKNRIRLSEGPESGLQPMAGACAGMVGWQMEEVK
ncbi:MAG: hypothetical protein Q7R22_006530 [Verrucomicrobiota bacterium JB025]|nr:hypothetical protein [Verrucomicrobiota bacterium JB025]